MELIFHQQEDGLFFVIEIYFGNIDVTTIDVTTIDVMTIDVMTIDVMTIDRIGCFVIKYRNSGEFVGGFVGWFRTDVGVGGYQGGLG